MSIFPSMDWIHKYAELLDRIARAFNRSGATRAVALDICKAFNKILHAGPLLMEFQIGYLTLFHLFSIIDGLELFWNGVNAAMFQ